MGLENKEIFYWDKYDEVDLQSGLYLAKIEGEEVPIRMECIGGNYLFGLDPFDDDEMEITHLMFINQPE